MPEEIKIVEVGPRDGLQNERAIIPTDVKIDFITRLADAGLKHIEVTSFVSPKAIPQLYDALEVVHRLPQREGVEYSALVPNMKGLERALESGIRYIAVFTAASDTFNQRNIKMSVQESLENFKPVVERAKREGLSVRGYVSTAFYCPFEDKIGKEKVERVVDSLFGMGVQEVSIGDTIGRATPDDVRDTMGYLLQKLPAASIAMHFHDTNGLALENVMASLDLGLRTFDSAAGGLGGCPYAPGAPGNLSTDALVALLESRGFHTGIDRDKLWEATAVIRKLKENTDDVTQSLSLMMSDERTLSP